MNNKQTVLDRGSRWDRPRYCVTHANMRWILTSDLDLWPWYSIPDQL